MSRPRAARPAYASKLPPKTPTWAPAIYRSMELLGTPPMPWQKQGARLVGALSKETCPWCSEPLPRFPTVLISIPRQQGKTALSRGVVTTVSQRRPTCRATGDFELYGTAQTRQHAARHVDRLGTALTQAKSAGALAPLKIGRGVGNEHVTWPNGAVYRPTSPTATGGHGDSVDHMLVDEAWSLAPHTLGGIRPAMTARPHAQMLIISTMGTHESSVWNSLVARGRLAVEEPDSTTAYLEYSAPSDDAIYDPSLWWQWMPALGRTVLARDIATALDDIPDEFERVRAYGNRLTASLSGVWPQEQVTDAMRIVDAPDHFVIAVDVNDNPLGASIATGHIAGTVDNPITATRVVDARQGIGPRWVPGVVRSMVTHRKVEAIVGDFGGPARQIYAELQAIADELDVPLLDRKPVDVAADTLRFTEALRTGRAAMQRDVEPLIEGLSGARVRRSRDLWWVARQLMVVDASPVIATILAHGLAEELEVRPRISVTVHW